MVKMIKKTCTHDCGDTVPINPEDINMLAQALEEDFVDYENREIFLDGEIDEYCVQKYIRPIMQFNQDDDMNEIPVDERQPIKIFISCVGGEVQMGLSLCNIIQASKTRIIGIVLPYAYSMAVPILACCHYRMAYPHSMILIHDGMAGIQNTGSKLKNQYEHIMELEQFVKDILVENTNITKRQLESKWKDEWYINANKALELGIIDEILTDIV